MTQFPRIPSAESAFSRRSAVCLMLLAAPFMCSLRCQEPPAPLTPAVNATIVLPPKLVQKEPATLAVLDALGRPAAGVAVRLGAGTTVATDSTGRAAFVAPQTVGVLRAELEGGSGQVSAPVIASPAAPQSLHIDSVERTILLKEPATVFGAGFSGVADENRVTFQGVPAVVLAASPASLVVLLSPHTPLGPASLSIGTGELAAFTVPIEVIALELSSSKATGHSGETGELRVTARGTERALNFAIRVQPAERIELPSAGPASPVPEGGRSEWRGRTSGGKQNSAIVAFTFRSPGAFSFELRLLPNPRAGQ